MIKTMFLDISVIIPYYNESKTIINTLNLLDQQIYKPKEIILVNSSSDDNTSFKIDNWISRKNTSDIIYKNIFKNTSFPSSSKNIGVEFSNCNYIAFMDCELNFDNSWLKNQYEKLINQKLDAVFGSVKLKGKSIFDICCVAHTYGYKKKRECIPGMLIKKNEFIRVGKFKNLRAGYDPEWRERLKNMGLKYSQADKTVVRYMDINYANNYKELLNKTILYTLASAELKTSIQNKILLFLTFLSIILVTFLPISFVIIITIYLLVRGYLMPILKSPSIIKFFVNPYFLFHLTFTVLTIDIGKVFSEIKSKIKIF